MRKIVIIDDDEMVGELIAKLLSNRGFNVRLANSGAAGLEMVRETMPDAILCDMRMPGMGGDQVLVVLKNHPKTNDIPVVFMSGQCDAEFIGQGDAFFWKPFNADHLAATIEQLVAKRELFSGASSAPSPSSSTRRVPSI